jgi:DNA-binding response OmpR family regulator
MPEGRKTVLLVEDDRMWARIHQRALEREGYEVLYASDGELGWLEAERSQPDVIVSDIGLPKLDGFALLERLKAEPATAMLPVIMYSRLCSKEDVQKCLTLGAYAYLMKAHHGPDDLLRCLSSLFAADAV